VPDFEIQWRDDAFEITLNRRNSPTLRISRQYRQMFDALDREKQNGQAQSKLDARTRKFLKSKLEAARWFISSINQRRDTLLRVMHAIVARQSEFFRFGPGNLRPMILKDIAEIIDMDISTVSRVVNGKYVQTEFGVFELKYFFSEGLKTESGDTVSNREVKNVIEMIIQEENKDEPLSDQRIAELLADQGFKIARRTVSKYREQLGIPVARMRREVMV
jgi:RNA polymerase sigma-54 factor